MKPRPWPEMTEPTPEQWLSWVLSLTYDEQLMIAARSLDALRRAAACFVEDHDGYPELIRVQREQASIEAYHRRILHERSVGQAYVNVALDQLCYRLGLDPTTAWRIPKLQEQRRRFDQAALRCAQYYGDAVEARVQSVISGSVA